MVEFAGFALPIQYSGGIVQEHRHTRTAASLFDVSHMGQLTITHEAMRVDDLYRAFEALTPVDVLGLPEKRLRYALLTNENGGIIDDFMFAKRPDGLFLVVNGARCAHDVAHLEAHLPTGFRVEVLYESRGLLALQGPESEAALLPLCDDIRGMRFMDFVECDVAGHACWVSRSGYSGEDGFEISAPIDATADIAQALIETGIVKPAGLGARDSLRLEAGLCLHGSDIDETTTPVEASLLWAIQKVRRPEGTRAGGYPGAARIAEQIEQSPDRVRVGLSPNGRAPMRGGARIYENADTTEPIGVVTSGGFGPSVNAPVSMGYVEAGLSTPGTNVAVEVRNNRLDATVVALPFVTPNYRRH